MVFPDEPTTVCGHWHTSYGHALLHNEGKQFPDKNKSWKKYCHFEPFLDHKIIALDACTAITGMCNCVVLEEPTGEMLYCNKGPDDGKKES